MVIRGIGDCVHLITVKLKKELNISFFLISTGIPFRGLKVNNIIRVYAPSISCSYFGHTRWCSFFVYFVWSQLCLFCEDTTNKQVLPIDFLVHKTALIYRKLSFTCVISNWISLFNITPLPSLHQLLISWCFQMVSSHKPSCYISYYWINPKCIQPLPLFQWEVYCYGVKYSNFAR